MTTDDLVVKARKVRLVIFDVDGVLTDGTLVYGKDGEDIKLFNVKDGLGIKLLMTHGIEVAVITARSSEPLKRRIKDLGIKYFYYGVHNKLSAFRDLVSKLGIDGENVAYVGDDVIDVPVMKKVGLAISVANGYEMVKEYTDWVTPSAGGRGAAREVADLILGSRMPLKEAYRNLLEPDSDNRENPGEAAG